MSSFLVGSKSWDVGSIADAAEAVLEITVTGSSLGDFVAVSSTLDVIDLELSAQVTAANTVTVSLSNLSSAGLDIGTTVIHVRVTTLSGLHITAGAV